MLALDLSGTQDLTAKAVVVRTGFVEVSRENGETARLPTFAGWVEAWTPNDTLAERALRDQAPYDVWVEEGWLNAVPGSMCGTILSPRRIAADCLELDVECLVYDRYAWRKFEQELDALGVTTTQFEHPQGGIRRAKELGLWMPGSVVELETAILDRRIRLRRSPVLICAMMSAAVEHDAFDNRWFSKRRAVNRIDALVALAMAVGQAAKGEPGSVYEDRGLLVI